LVPLGRRRAKAAHPEGRKEGRREDDWIEFHTAEMFTGRARLGDRVAIMPNGVPMRLGRLRAPGR